MALTRAKWLLRKIRRINTERLNRHLDVMVKTTGKSRTYLKFSIFWNFLTTGCSYTDYFRGDYVHLTRQEKKTFVTAKKYYNLIHYFNDQRYIILLGDKLVFLKYFRELIGRAYFDLRTGTVEGLARFLADKDVVFAKDPFGESGHGITRLKVADFTPQALFETCRTQKQYLLEQEIIQCGALNAVNPHSVISLRVLTLLKDGKAHVIGNALRVNKGAAEVVGGTDDLYFALTPEGTVDGNVVDDYGTVFEAHPLTGFRFSELRVPGVQTAFDLCCRAAEKLPQVRYVGWDVAFTDRGPELIEGNDFPGYGLLQFYRLKGSRTGHLKDIEAVIGDELLKIKL